MEQSQRMAHILLQATRQIEEAMPRLRSFQDLSHFTVEVNRLENDGDRTSRHAIASLFDNGIDPMVVIRWKDIFERLEEAIDALRARREHARGHRHQEQLTGEQRRRHPRDRRGHGARIRLHERLPRHGERDRDLGLDPRDVAALRRRDVGRAQLRGRVHLAEGRGHRRVRDRRLGRGHHDRRLRRPRRRDRVEHRDVAGRAAVELVARPHRRPDRLGVRGRRPQRHQRRRDHRDGPRARRGRPGARLLRRRARRSSSSTGWSATRSSPAGEPRLPAGADP